jgi:uncharacterized protein YodC (DUF2158 family)
MARELVAQTRFKTGDVVVLNSGGPKMTAYILQGEEGIDLINVSWFVRAKLHRDAFSATELRLVNE